MDALQSELNYDEVVNLFLHSVILNEKLHRPSLTREVSLKICNVLLEKWLVTMVDLEHAKLMHWPLGKDDALIRRTREWFRAIEKEAYGVIPNSEYYRRKARIEHFLSEWGGKPQYYDDDDRLIQVDYSTPITPEEEVTLKKLRARVSLLTELIDNASPEVILRDSIFSFPWCTLTKKHKAEFKNSLDTGIYTYLVMMWLVDDTREQTRVFTNYADAMLQDIYLSHTTI